MFIKKLQLSLETFLCAPGSGLDIFVDYVCRCFLFTSPNSQGNTVLRREYYLYLLPTGASG